MFRTGGFLFLVFCEKSYVLITDSSIDDMIITTQKRPRIFYRSVNYLGLYMDHGFIIWFHLSRDKV